MNIVIFSFDDYCSNIYYNDIFKLTYGFTKNGYDDFIFVEDIKNIDKWIKRNNILKEIVCFITEKISYKDLARVRGDYFKLGVVNNKSSVEFKPKDLIDGVICLDKISYDRIKEPNIRKLLIEDFTRDKEELTDEILSFIMGDYDIEE